MKKKMFRDLEDKAFRRSGVRLLARAAVAGALTVAAFAQFVVPSVSRAASVVLLEGSVAAQRAVQGRVLDKKDSPIIGAVVYLKDTRSLSVKSYLTDESGRFHFGQLADGADYEVWAEQNGKRSSSKSISQFNSKLDIQFTLKIDLAN